MVEIFENDGELPDKEPRSIIKLRQLIATMDKAEKNAFKRYIRNYSGENHDARFTQLFDCVNECLVEMERKSQKTAAKPDLKASKRVFYKKFAKRFLQRKFAKVHELGSVANYLYAKILESLRNQQLNTYARRELYASMLDIQLLYRKGLYDECLSMVYESQKLAKRLEALPQSLELIQIERQILLSQRQKGLATKLRSLHKIEQQYLHDFKATADFGDLRAEAYLAVVSKTDLDQDEILRGKMNNFLNYQTNQHNNSTFDLKFYFHSIMSFMILNDLNNPSIYLKSKHKGLEEAIEHVKSIVDLFDNYPDRKKEEPMRYRHNLINYFSYTFMSENSFKVKLSAYDEEWRKISKSDPDYIHTVVYLHLLEYIKTKEFKKGQQLLEENNVFELMQELKSEIPLRRFQVICHLAVIIYFIRSEFPLAQKWSSLSLSVETKDSDPEVMLACEIYHLLSRFEKGYQNLSLLRSTLLQPIIRRMEEMKEQPASGQSILDALDAILRVETKGKTIQKVAAEHLQKLRVHFPDKASYNNFNIFMGWLESKESGRSLRSAIDSYL